MNEFDLLREQVMNLNTAVTILSNRLSAALPTAIELSGFTENLNNINYQLEVDFILSKCDTDNGSMGMSDSDFFKDFLLLNNIDAFDISEILNKKVKEGKFTSAVIYTIGGGFPETVCNIYFQYNNWNMCVSTDSFQNIVAKLYDTETFGKELAHTGLKNPMDTLKNKYNELKSLMGNYMERFHSKHNEYPNHIHVGQNPHTFCSGIKFLQSRDTNGVVTKWDIEYNGNNHSDIFTITSRYSNLKSLIERSIVDINKKIENLK